MDNDSTKVQTPTSPPDNLKEQVLESEPNPSSSTEKVVDIDELMKTCNEMKEEDQSNNIITINPKSICKIDRMIKIGEDLYLEVKKLVEGGTKINQLNLMALVIKCMEVLDKVTGLTGTEKKSLVLKVIDKLVDEYVDDESEKLIIKGSINMIVPTAIDAIVDGIKGKLDVGKMKNKFKKCCPCF